MIQRDELDLRIDAWFDDAAAGSAATSAASILEAIAATPQRRRFATIRSPFIGVPGGAPFVPPRRVLLVAILALLAIAVAATLIAGSRPRVPAPFVPRAVIDAQVSEGVVAVAPAPNGIWIGGDGVARRVHATDNGVDEVPIAIPQGHWTGILEHDGTLWGANWLDGQVLRTDIATGRPQPTIFFTPSPSGLAWAHGIWVASGASGGLTRFDPSTGAITGSVDGPQSFTTDGETIWYLDWPTLDALVGIDAESREEVKRLPLPPGLPMRPMPGLTIGPEGRLWLWTMGGQTSRVDVIDPSTGPISSFTVPGSLFGGIVRNGDQMWAVSGPMPGSLAGQIQELTADGPTDHVLPLPDGLDPDGAVVVGDSLWIPSESTHQVFRYPLDALR